MTAGSSLAPNGDCKVAVTFDPQSTGTLTGTLTVVAAETPLAVSLSGSGAMPPPVASSGGGGAIDLVSLTFLFGISVPRRRQRRAPARTGPR